RALSAALSVRVEAEGDVVAIERRKSASDQKAALTFADFFDEYLTLRQHLVRIDEIKREISVDVIPTLGTKPPSQITAADIDAIGTKIKARLVARNSARSDLHPKARKANSAAYRMVMHMKAMFNYALLDRPALAEK